MSKIIYIKDYDIEVEIPDGADMQQVQAALAKQFPAKSQQTQSPTDNATTTQGISDRLKQAARVVAPYARPALEMGGALGGAVLASPGNVLAPGLASLGGAGLGYAAGRQGANLLEQYAGTRQPKGLGQELLEAAVDVPTGAAMEAGGGIVGKGIGGFLKYASKTAPRLYESVVKIPPRSISKTQRDKIIKTALDEKISATQKGLGKLQEMIDETNEKIAMVIDDAADFSKDARRRNLKSGRKFEYDENMIPIDNILSRLNSVKDWAKKSYADPTPIYKMIDDYKVGVKNTRGSEIAVDEAQKLKQGIYRRLSDAAYGEYSTPAKEIDKQFARGIKEELFEKFPQLQQLNARDSALISLNNVLEKSVNRLRNRNILGLAEYGGTISGAEIAGGPGAAVGAVATKIFSSPAVLSQLAFALNKLGQKTTPAALSRMIGYPIGKQTAIKPEKAEQAIGSALSAMATPAQAMGVNQINKTHKPTLDQQPNQMVPESKLSLKLYHDAQRAYLSGDYDNALTFFKQLLREDPKRAVIYDRAIKQIETEKESVKNYSMNRGNIQ